MQKLNVLQYADLTNAIKLLKFRGTNKQFPLSTWFLIWIFYTFHDVMYERVETAETFPN